MPDETACDVEIIIARTAIFGIVGASDFLVKGKKLALPRIIPSEGL
jgi:hypothetical protein